MYTKSKKIAYRASQRVAIFAGFTEPSFSTATPVLAINPCSAVFMLNTPQLLGSLSAMLRNVKSMNKALTLVLIALTVLCGDAVAEDPAKIQDAHPKPASVSSPGKDLVKVGEIDFFSYGDLNPAKLREGLPIQQGQSVSRDSWQTIHSTVAESIKRMTGFGPTDILLVCCDDLGAAMIYIGIAGGSSKPLVFNPAPHGPARLPSDALLLEKKYDEAWDKAVMEKAQEDKSKWYALSTEPTLRAIQLSVREFTLQHSNLVRDVLQSSEAVEHRRAAALFLGYDDASAGQIEALTQASRDADWIVRNNAVRALGVLASSSVKTGVRVAAEPFIELLSSDKWTDRNKGIFVLMSLTQSRTPALLAELRQKAMPALIEMARWQVSGHASAARIVLGRIAGLDEAGLLRNLNTGEVEALITAAEKVH